MTCATAEQLRALDDFVRVSVFGVLVRAGQTVAATRKLSTAAQSAFLNRDLVLHGRCHGLFEHMPRVESALVLTKEETAGLDLASPPSHDLLLDAPLPIAVFPALLGKLDSFIGSVDGRLSRAGRRFSETTKDIRLCWQTTLHCTVVDGSEVVRSVLRLEEKELAALRALHSTQLPRARSMSWERDREKFFLLAGLRLLQDQEARQREILSPYIALGFPALNELILMGPMCKVRYKISKAKFAALSPGRLVMCSPIDESPSPKPAKVIALLRGQVICRPLERGVLESRWPLELITSGGEDVKVLSMSTRADRDAWCKAISQAALMENRYADTVSQSQQCTVVESKVARHQDVGAFLTQLHDVCSQGPLVIPVEWVQMKLSRPRGEVDASFEQLLKDTSRDQVRVNSQLVEPSTTEGVLGALAAAIAAIGVDADEGKVLRCCLTCLLASNRTQCSGLAFEAVSALLYPPPTLVLVPSSLTQEPIDLFVEPVEERVVEPVLTAPPAAPAERKSHHRRAGSDGMMSFAMSSDGNATFRLSRVSDLLKFERKPRPDESPAPVSKRSTTTTDSSTASSLKKTPSTHRSTSSNDVVRQCRVSVRARSGFSLMDLESSGRTEVVRISAVFSREFMLAGDFTVALNQGRVVLSIDKLSDVGPMSPQESHTPRPMSSSGSVLQLDESDGEPPHPAFGGPPGAATTENIAEEEDGDDEDVETDNEAEEVTSVEGSA